MKSKITSKFQITIPKEIRTKLKLNIADIIEWEKDGNRVFIKPVEMPFLKYKAVIKAGPGNIKDDILRSRKIRSIKYK